MSRIVAVNAETLFNYATTSGHLYTAHCALVRRNCGRAMWAAHVSERVLPGYRKEFGERGAILETAEKNALITRLKDYYTAHLAEMA